MIAISVKDVHKSFKIYYDKGQSFKEKILFRNRNKYENREVLKGVSFDVKKGEAIGLIGKNGCGKSTLLKLMTQIIYPDKGSIKMNGRISSLIELGAGFHPDMSGRENIYTNASIFGLNRKEIDERIKQIIDFSELEEFIDNPVRTYSSGMYMRLAFAVAINVDADILLIDEILAVGDANFQAKCFNKLREIKASGTTIVIVSHSLGQIEQICERSVWIEDGKIRKEGSPRNVHPYYLDFMGNKNTVNNQQQKDDIDKNDSQNKNRWGNRDITITKICFFNSDDKECYNYRTNDNIKIKIDYQCKKEIDDVVIGIGIFRNDGIECYGTTTQIDRIGNISLLNNGEICIRLPNINLIAGEYWFDIAFASINGVTTYDYWKKSVKFNIHSNITDIGIIRLEHDWIIEKTACKVRSNTISKKNGDRITINHENEKLTLNNSILDDDLIKDIAQRLINQIKIFGDKERVFIHPSAQMVNTLFNTSSGKIYVGEYTFTGHNVSIITGTHYVNKYGVDRMNAPTEGNDIFIGKGVWLCSNSTILGPCNIGDNAVIAAGAVVIPNTIIPPNTIFGGVPAKKIKDIVLNN